MRNTSSATYEKFLNTMKEATILYGHKNGSSVLLSRSTEEILEDMDYELSFAESHRNSMLRRGPKRYESKFVLNYLDTLYSLEQRVGDLAVSQVRMLSSIDSLSYQNLLHD